MNIIKRRVHFYETDGMKVVHHANYFKWFEEARVEYLRAGGICLNELMKKGIVFPIVEVQARYLKSAKYDDVIIIKTYLKEINRIKLTFYYEVVKEEKGEKVVEEVEVQIDIGISSFIPDTYIENSSQKIEIYQDIANCRTESDIMDIIDEISDRYGDMPKEVENLIEIARIKNIARPRHIVKIQEKQMGFVFTFAEDIVIEAETISKLLKQYKNNIHFSAIGKPYITLKIEKNKIEEIKKFILNFDEIEKDDNNK